MMNQEKMIRTASTMNTVLRILRKIKLIAMIVLIVAVAVISVVHFINPDAVIGTDVNRLDMGNITLELSPDAAPTNREILVFTWIITAFAVGCGLALYDILLQGEKILKPMMEGDPFRPCVADSVRRMGILALIFNLTTQISQFCISAYTNSFLRSHMLTDGGVMAINNHFTLDLTGVLVFFILLLVSYVFRYGAKLQQLSDETL